ncbi:MAG TPA: glycosyltransferase family 39 protein [Terriglobales bacterium]|nr:glycosyltransferase family 39 protein [Terriglobales bacterium]
MRISRHSSPGTQRGLHSALVSSLAFAALAFAALLALHAPLLRLPYFWDEAGYYVPAARDLLLSGRLIPHSTPSNAHPPLVMAYLALWWKMAGFSPAVTRVAMILAASFTLLGLFRLAEAVANREVAIAATVCTGLYPVFFAQSSLAHLDIAAAGLTFWGLYAYASSSVRGTVLWFSLAALAKETAILAPLALLAWELLSPWINTRDGNELFPPARKPLWLLLTTLPLSGWYAYHYFRTGFVFGNPEFFRYNVGSTLHPLRIVLALLIRLWQTFGYFHLLLLTLATLFAMWLPPMPDQSGERPRIALHLQFAMLSVIAAYLFAMAVIGGAELARYMLPVVPLVILIGVSTLWRRVRWWKAVVVVVALSFVAGWFINPPYGFAPEDNLAYWDYIRLHQHAEEFLETRYPMARVLTAWPASDELSHPYLGYVTRPMRVVRIENFAIDQVLAAAEIRSTFEVALVFSTKYEPAHPLLEDWSLWQEWKTRFFGYHRDLPPAAAAQILGGSLVYTENRNGQWVGVIELEQVLDARADRECGQFASAEAGRMRQSTAVGRAGSAAEIEFRRKTPIHFPTFRSPSCPAPRSRMKMNFDPAKTNSAAAAELPPATAAVPES